MLSLDIFYKKLQKNLRIWSNEFREISILMSHKCQNEPKKVEKREFITKIKSLKA